MNTEFVRQIMVTRKLRINLERIRPKTDASLTQAHQDTGSKDAVIGVYIKSAIVARYYRLN